MMTCTSIGMKAMVMVSKESPEPNSKAISASCHQEKQHTH